MSQKSSLVQLTRSVPRSLTADTRLDELGVDEQSAEHDERQRCCYAQCIVLCMPSHIEMYKAMGCITAQQHSKNEDRQARCVRLCSP